jgi:hypothetical protein
MDRQRTACMTRRGIDGAHVPRRSAGRVRSSDAAVFARTGQGWTITFDGQTTLLRPMKGLAYLAHLLSTPGRERHVLDLVSLERPERGRAAASACGSTALSYDDAGPLLDDAARSAYRARLADLADQVAEARAFEDDERAAVAQGEHDALVRELSRAFGIGGRARRAGSASERARASVTLAIRSAMKRISDEHRGLGEHLGRTIRTGTYCSYLPDPRVRIVWDTGEGVRRRIA